jgi:hypothetical protein
MSFRRGMFTLKKHWFALLWTFIGSVSLFDGFLVARLANVIAEVEENPVGSYLLKLDDGDPELFLRTKAAGTLVVLSALVGLYRYRRCWAVPVTGSLASFQCGLLLYLTSGAPTKCESHFHAEYPWICPYFACVDNADDTASSSRARVSSTSASVIAAQKP